MQTAEAVIGHNNPPEVTPYEAVRVHIEDLLVEARNWADGAVAESQPQADAIARLIEDFRKAEKAADDARKEEVRPLDEQRDAIQARYNLYIAPLKNKQPGKIPLAMNALKAALNPWLIKLEDERRAREEAARKEAEEKARIAAEAMRAAEASNLTAREEAEALLADANAAQAHANKAAKDKAHAKGEGRAIGLRSYFTPVMTNAQDALKHYVATRPDDVRAFLLRLAEEDVRCGKRTIPGFEINEEKKVA